MIVGSLVVSLLKPWRAAGLYHDVCGTLNGRRLADGTLLYGCTCNLSVTLAAINRLQFDTGFPDAAFEVRCRGYTPNSAAPWAGLRTCPCCMLEGALQSLKTLKT